MRLKKTLIASPLITAYVMMNGVPATNRESLLPVAAAPARLSHAAHSR